MGCQSGKIHPANATATAKDEEEGKKVTLTFSLQAPQDVKACSLERSAIQINLALAMEDVAEDGKNKRKKKEEN